MFSRTFVLVVVTSFTHSYISTLITLNGRCDEAAPFANLHHSAPLEMLSMNGKNGARGI